MSAPVTSGGAALYLDLLKRSLTFSLWDEPGVPVEMFNNFRPLHKRVLVGALARGLRLLGYGAVTPVRHTRAQMLGGLVCPIYAHTMIGTAGLDNLQFCVETALAEGVPGDLIETGVWRGGAAILMRAVLAAHGVTDRRVFVADSFEGLPEADAAPYPADAGSHYHTLKFLAVSRREVEENFEKYGLLDSQVVFLEGWFKETLPRAPVERLAVLRLDGDMYESTAVALEHLYPKLSPGGFCIVDDYGLEGCRRAVDDYRERQSVDCPVVPVDQTRVYWRKAAA
jgi:O-methyltransferase